MRVFVDSNVAVSAVAARGLSADLLRVLLVEHTVLTGNVLLGEVERVLRDKLRVPEPTIRSVLALFGRQHIEPRPDRLPTDLPEMRDPDDQWVLASALAAGAEVLVTGDQDLLTVPLPPRHALRIMSPRELWSVLRPPNTSGF